MDRADVLPELRVAHRRNEVLRKANVVADLNQADMRLLIVSRGVV